MIEDSGAFGRTPVAEAAVLHQRVAEAGDLAARGDHDGALAECAAFLSDFSGSENGWVATCVAYVMLLEAISLRSLGRVEDAVAGFDRLRSRFSDSRDPFARDHVARGLILRGQMLAKNDDLHGALTSYDLLAGEFAADENPSVARRVSWALWNSAQLLKGLDREAEREDLFERLAARRVEGVDAKLDAHVAWCLYHQAWQRSEEGESAAREAVCAELVERFADASAPPVIRLVIEGLLLNASQDDEAQIAVSDEIVSRFGDIQAAEVVEGVTAALRRKGRAQDHLGRHEQALETIDTGLALLDQSSDALVGAKVDLLNAKGIVVEHKGVAGESEALVVYDSAIAAYSAASSTLESTRGLEVICWTLTRKIDLLCKLGRSEQADEVLGQLQSLLGDVVDPTPPADPVLDADDEAELARVFADVFVSGKCWSALDPPRRDMPGDELCSTAIWLYRLTERWSFSEQGGMAVQAAVGALRDVADGYALLSTGPSAEDLARLPLPKRFLARRDEMLQRFGVDDWLAEHDLSALPARDDDRADIETEHDPSRDSDTPKAADVVRFALSTFYDYGLRLALCDSPTGRAILHSDNLRAQDCGALATARSIVSRLGPDHQLAPLGLMCVLTAQGLFISSHAQPASSSDVYPSPDMLREMLDLDEWSLREQIAHEEGALPHWLQTTASDDADT